MLRARGRRAGAAVDSASDARRSIAGARMAPGTANAAALAALAAIITSRLRVTCMVPVRGLGKCREEGGTGLNAPWMSGYRERCAQDGKCYRVNPEHWSRFRHDLQEEPIPRCPGRVGAGTGLASSIPRSPDMRAALFPAQAYC